VHASARIGFLHSFVKPEGRLRIGDALAALGRSNGLSNADVEALSTVREQTPATPLSFK